MSTTPLDPFLVDLIGRLESDPRVVGLVLAGSSAERDRRDRWSDHDFLVVTEDGTPEGYRTDMSWLPDADGVLLSFRETAHGLKVLYRSGLMIEFAVFDRAEFATCALNHYEVVIDRGGVAEAAAGVRERTMSPRSVDRLVCLRMFLSLVYIGTGRARRGERLSANVFIRDYATGQLLRLAADLLPGGTGAGGPGAGGPGAGRDALDPWRRFEQVAPDLAADLDAALARPIDEVGPALIRVADAFLRVRWAEYPADEAAGVLALLARD